MNRVESIWQAMEMESKNADHVQSFHWFATNEALKEIHRVMRPEAIFGMIWNIEDCKVW